MISTNNQPSTRQQQAIHQQLINNYIANLLAIDWPRTSYLPAANLAINKPFTSKYLTSIQQSAVNLPLTGHHQTIYQQTSTVANSPLLTCHQPSHAPASNCCQRTTINQANP
jgi:hypothetical protein